MLMMTYIGSICLLYSPSQRFLLRRFMWCEECPVYMGYFQAQNKLLTPKARGVRQLAQNLFFVTRFSPYDEKSRANN